MHQALGHPGVGLEVSLLGKKSLTRSPTRLRRVARDFWIRRLLVFGVCVCVIIMVFLVLRLKATLPFSGVKCNHDAVTVKIVPLKTTVRGGN